MKMVTTRVDETIIARLDKVVEALAAERPGVTICRGDAFRVTVERGLQAVESELGLAGQSSK